MKSLLLVATLLVSNSSFGMGKPAPTPDPAPSPSLPAPVSSPAPVKPLVIIIPGVYHDSSTTADPNSCSVEVRVSMNSETVYVTKVTNYLNANYCDDQGQTERYDFVLNRNNEWKLMSGNGTEIDQTGTTEFVSTESDRKTGIFERVADAAIRAKHFPQYGKVGWTYGNGVVNCILGSGDRVSCYAINEDIILKNGNCDSAKTFAANLALMHCKGTGYARCDIYNVNTSIYVGRTLSDYEESGCEATVLVEGQ